MPKSLPPVRYIRPETIQTGDLIRVTTKTFDRETSHTGRARRMHYEGSDRVWSTEQGQVLVVWNPHYKFQGRVTLIERAPYPQETLDFSFTA